MDTKFSKNNWSNEINWSDEITDWSNVIKWKKEIKDEDLRKYFIKKGINLPELANKASKNKRLNFEERISKFGQNALKAIELNEIANRTCDLGDEIEGYDIYTQALQKNNNISEIYKNIATTAINLGRFKEALTYSEKAISLFPLMVEIFGVEMALEDYIRSLTNKASALFQLANYEESLTACEEGLIFCDFFPLLNIKRKNLSKSGNEKTKLKRELTESFISSFTGKDFSVSPNSRRFALIERPDYLFQEPWFLRSPSSEEKSWTEVNEFVVLDGQPQKKYKKIECLTFSPDSMNLAYIGRQNNGWAVVLNGKEQNYHENIGGLTFSPCNRVVYGISEKGKWAWVVDNQVGPFFEGVGTPICFNPINKSFAYMAKSDNKWFLVVDNKQAGKQYDNFGANNPPAPEISFFSPDGKNIAYIAMENQKSFIVMNGKELQQYDGVSNLYFSDDSKHIVYSARKNNKWCVVFDHIEGKNYDMIGDIGIVSPDGNHIAYIAKDNNKCFVVKDEIEGKKYSMILAHTVTFSPDSQHIAYIAIEDNKTFLVIDGEEQKSYDTMANFVLFSKDSRHIVCSAFKNGKYCVIKDGQEYKLYDNIIESSPFLTPDGKHVIYAVTEGRNSFVVVDDNEGKSYQAILPKQKIRFDSAKSFHYLVQNNNDIFLVEESIC